MLALDGSDDDDDSGMSGSIPAEPLQGTLSKWTNYIHGWQNRSVATGTVLASKSPIHCKLFIKQPLIEQIALHALLFITATGK